MPVFTALLTTILILQAGSLQAADKKDKGGLLGNSYGSQMEQLKDNIIRITTRQKVTGTLPGSVMPLWFVPHLKPRIWGSRPSR